jgi:hypothetical protein
MINESIFNKNHAERLGGIIGLVYNNTLIF